MLNDGEMAIVNENLIEELKMSGGKQMQQMRWTMES